MLRCVRVLPRVISRPMTKCQYRKEFLQGVSCQGVLCRFSSQVPSRSWDHGFLSHAEVGKRFEEFDQDRDGLITVAECRAAMDQLEREISDGVVQESMWKWDANKDGMVDYFEFMDYFLNTKPQEHSGQEHDAKIEFDSIESLLQHCIVEESASVASSLSRSAKAELIKTFNCLDTNQDGFLDKKELIVALRSMRPDASSIQIDILFSDLIAKSDRNNDGLIDLYEFSSKVVQQGLYG